MIVVLVVLTFISVAFGNTQTTMSPYQDSGPELNVVDLGQDTPAEKNYTEKDGQKLGNYSQPFNPFYRFSRLRVVGAYVIVKPNEKREKRQLPETSGVSYLGRG